MAKVDMYEWPLWEQEKHCMKMLDTALAECRSRGKAMVALEAAYYSAKDREAFAMLEAGYANTFIQTVIKGRPKVSEAMMKFHEAEVLYKNAVEAVNVYKLQLRSLESEIEREWNAQNRM